MVIVVNPLNSLLLMTAAIPMRLTARSLIWLKTSWAGFGWACSEDAASDRLNDWLSRAKLFIIRRVKSGLSTHPFDWRWLVCWSAG
jgi:hypothetical protein